MIDPSKTEKLAIKHIREKRKLFDTELGMLAARQFHEAAIADETRTRLMTRQSNFEIDYDLVLSAMKMGIEAIRNQEDCSISV